jgi:hypothetical protein
MRATVVVLFSGFLSALAPSLALAEESPAKWNKGGVQTEQTCVTLKPGVARAAVRDVEGNQLQSSSGAVFDAPEAKEQCSSTAGIGFEQMEAVVAKGLTMYYTRPFEGGGQSHGFISVGELAGTPSVNSSNEAGNGTEAPPAPGAPVYLVIPADIPGVQGYIGPSDGNWHTYSVYGRPLAGAKFALMSWSWTEVEHGGVGRAAVAEGIVFHPANVFPIASTSVSGARTPNGEVVVRYGYVYNGTKNIWGWMVVSHIGPNGECVNHMAYAGGGPPLPGTLCAGATTAFQFDGGSLWRRTGSGEALNLGPGMAPSVAEIAFHGSNGDLFTRTPSGEVWDLGLGMAQNTSPSLASDGE